VRVWLHGSCTGKRPGGGEAAGVKFSENMKDGGSSTKVRLGGRPHRGAKEGGTEETWTVIIATIMNPLSLVASQLATRILC